MLPRNLLMPKLKHLEHSSEGLEISLSFYLGYPILIRGYYINPVGQYANEEVIKKYVQGQGKDQQYQKIHKSQLKLF
jgi:hypothetical protein